MYEPEKDEIPICDFSKLEDQEDKNILEKYTNFMKEDYKNEDADNVIMLVDLREKGANNENFKNKNSNIHCTLEEKLKNCEDLLHRTRQFVNIRQRELFKRKLNINKQIFD